VKTLGAIAVGLLLLAAGCGRQQPGTVIAKVGDAELTLEEALQAVDTTRAPLSLQVRAFAFSWVTSELLHQEAKRRGLDKSASVERQLDDVKRQLAVQALLDQEDQADTAAPGDDALREYFNAHAAEFFLREDMVKLNLIVLQRREEASALAAAVSGGTSWNAAVDRLRADSTVAPTIRFQASGQFYSRRTLTPPDLWKVASALGVNEVSFPVRVGDAFAVLQLLGSIAEGKAAEFEFVRDEVLERLAMERRRSRYDALVAGLRASTPVQVMLSPASATDTTQLLPHE
jgi:peptidyl-prolyl cis-trans isomerase C